MNSLAGNLLGACRQVSPFTVEATKQALARLPSRGFLLGFRQVLIERTRISPHLEMPLALAIDSS
jgi:hypothetical protein